MEASFGGMERIGSTKFLSIVQESFSSLSLSLFSIERISSRWVITSSRYTWRIERTRGTSLPRVINNHGDTPHQFHAYLFLISMHGEMPAVLGAGIPRKIKINRQTGLNHNRARIFEASRIPSDIHRYFPTPSPAKRGCHEKSIGHPLSNSRFSFTYVQRLSLNVKFLPVSAQRFATSGDTGGQFVDCIVQIYAQQFIPRYLARVYMRVDYPNSE